MPRARANDRIAARGGRGWAGGGHRESGSPRFGHETARLRKRPKCPFWAAGCLTVGRSVTRQANAPPAAAILAAGPPLLEQGLDIPEAIGKGLLPAGIADDLRHMVGHDHAIESNFPIRAQRARHVDVAVVRQRLDELEKAAA